MQTSLWSSAQMRTLGRRGRYLKFAQKLICKHPRRLDDEDYALIKENVGLELRPEDSSEEEEEVHPTPSALDPEP